MTVTIYTDASIVGRRGWWAAVILSEDADPIEHSGTLKGHFRSSTTCELAAICNALHRAYVAGILSPGGQVRVYSDNDVAVLRANGTYRNKSKTDSRLIEATRWIRGFCKAHRVTLTAEHVKGHQPIGCDDPHSFFNRRCDMLCAIERRARDPMTLEEFVAREKLYSARRKKAA